MASFIPTNGPMVHALHLPIGLQTSQALLGGFVAFLALKHTRMLLIVNEKGGCPNLTATALVGFEVGGPAILCNPEDVE